MAKPQQREPIPISHLEFAAQSCQFARSLGVHAATSLKTGKAGSREYEIAWYPWLRAFRVVFRCSSQPTREGWIPEHQATYWEEPQKPAAVTDGAA